MTRHNWTQFDFSREGVNLHCWKKGKGAPLVLLHGITDNGRCWGRVADDLAESYTVYAPDARAHGKSDAPATGYSYAEYAADVVELLRERGHANAIVMGHSFGGMVAITLASAFPDAVSRLILVDPPLFDRDLTTPPETVDRERYGWFEWARLFQHRTRAELVSLCHTQSPQWSADECEHWADSKLEVRPRMWEKDGVQIMGNWRGALTKITAPTLLVYGEPRLRGLVDDAKAADVVNLLPDGQAVQIANAGHSVQHDQHAEFMRVIDTFLQR